MISDFKNIYSKTIVFLFAIVITIPAIVGLSSNNARDILITEKNIKNPLKLKSSLNNYYQNEFFSNSLFVNSYLNFKNSVLKENALPYSVMEGKDGWYFLGNYYSNTVNDHFGNDSFSIVELEKIKNNLLSLDLFFKSKNIEYCIVIPPNKNTIYSEYLPFQLKKKKTKLDALNYFIKDIDIPFIDLTKTLKTHKDSVLTYYKTDSHWNSYGAYLGYKQIMNQISNQIDVEPLSLENYTLDNEYEKYGDLTSLLKLRIIEKSIRLINESMFSNYDKVDEYLSFDNKKNNGFKLLMFRDSFANDLIPFFNDTFAETTYIKYYNIKEKVLNEEKPDFIIIEVIERDLRKLLKIKSPF